RVRLGPVARRAGARRIRAVGPAPAQPNRAGAQRRAPDAAVPAPVRGGAHVRLAAQLPPGDGAPRVVQSPAYGLRPHRLCAYYARAVLKPALGFATPHRITPVRTGPMVELEVTPVSEAGAARRE